MSRVDWNPGPFRARLDADLRRRADYAGSVGRARVRALLSTPGGRGRYSRPGQPPFYRTGRLWRSIAYVVVVTATRTYAAIGSSLYYARFLSRGIPGRLAPRPFLDRMLAESEKLLRAILVHGG